MLRLPGSKPAIEGNIPDKQPVQLDRAHLTPDTRHNSNKVLVCLNCGTNGHFAAAYPMKLDTTSKNSSLPFMRKSVYGQTQSIEVVAAKFNLPLVPQPLSVSAMNGSSLPDIHRH